MPPTEHAGDAENSESLMGILKEISLRRNPILSTLYSSLCIASARIVERPLILCFHRVKVQSDSLLDKRVGCISPRNFRKVLKFVKLMGYKFVALDELVSMVANGKLSKVAAVTFDDGFKDLYENAYPILKENRIPFTLFLITSLVDSEHLLWLHRLYMSVHKLADSERDVLLGKYAGSDGTRNPVKGIGEIIHSGSKKALMGLEAEVSSAAGWKGQDEASIAKDLYLSKKEIEEMTANGLTLEVHGHEHWPLKSLNELETKEEIGACVNFIRERFQGSPKFLSLQYGKSNGCILDVTKAFGLIGMATMEGRLIREGFLDPFRLPRFCVYDNIQAFHRALSIELMKTIFGRARRPI